jgi:tape measure domain-containing protein
MSGSSDAGRLLVRIEATTAQLRQQLQDAERQVQGTAGKIDASLKRADDAFARMNKASEAAQQAIGGLSNRLGPLGAALSSIGPGGAAAAAGIAAMGVGLTAIARAGDTATATLARLSSATGGLAQAQAAMRACSACRSKPASPSRNRPAPSRRFAVAAKEIGGTNAQVLQLVAGIQKAGIVAGASMQETGAATQQLAQALASGTLQGDELRSLLENMPQLAQALARELGVGIGQLRKMGEEGKLTADTVFPALLAAAKR